jgi:hypothetical protein
MTDVKAIAAWIRHEVTVRNEQAFQQGSWLAVADAIEKRFGDDMSDNKETDDMIKDALTNKFALVIYQTEKGLSYGVVEAEAIAEVVDRVDQGGDNYFASAIATAEGGDIQKAKTLTDGLLTEIRKLWGIAREMFVETTHD